MLITLKSIPDKSGTYISVSLSGGWVGYLKEVGEGRGEEQLWMFPFNFCI